MGTEEVDKRSFNGRRLPSGSSLGDLWECRGRFLVEQNFADKESEEANLGTEGHRLLAENTPIDDVPDELNFIVWKARVLRDQLLAEWNVEGEVFCEKRFWCKEGDEAYFSGEIDYFVIGKEEAVIIDYKLLQGFYKSAANNRQLQAYAVLIHQEYPHLKKIKVGLVQPMLDRVTGAEIDTADLGGLRKDLIDLCKEIQVKGQARTAGSHCKWCKALPHCPEAAEWVVKEIGEIMENVSNDKLSEKMCVVPTVERWVKEVKGLTKERLEKGLKVPEFKLRKSGNITTLNAKGASGVLFEANFPMGDFLECCTLKEAELVKKWAKYTDQKAAPAKRDLRLRLEAHITQRPKAQSVTREA
jgi:hypothetical protein